jgi:hypothetical protein
VPTLPPTNPAPLRHLGTSSGPRPLRSPAVLGLIALLVLVALPVYLLRRPKSTKSAAVEPAPRADAATAVSAPPAFALPAQSEVAPGKRIALADAKTARCVPKGGGRVTTERCDRLTPFEDALARAIRDNVACAPTAMNPYTVSFVLSLDFDRKSMHLWAGRSGSIKKRLVGDLIRCVEHAIVLPEWETVAHQHQKYDVNIIAAYPGSSPSVPSFGATNTAPLGGFPGAPFGASTMPAFGAAPLPPPGAPNVPALGTTAPPTLGAPAGISPFGSPTAPAPGAK